jgi:hypothetical protein
MMARPFLASAGLEEADGGFATMRRGRWCLVWVEGGGALVRGG